ncbi:hypothetical protein A3SI_02176 [Nitritalea halalkaliphila LW7]|uniref:Adhesin domain-containing protein n=1 Tax=Nitritalea halalkaliphila LW7 TaxID=1189621 RepID=I5CAG4_9BACT|nr:hypothetical protein [Nitritalea halalkaliphila]EIM78816.1 hypothetical protein A3SI_02176 [Nitritalea halalkaliphila LW7]
MLRVPLLLLLLFCSVQLHAQQVIKRDYTAAKREGVESIYFHFDVYKGVSRFHSSMGEAPIWVKSSLSNLNILPQFDDTMADGRQEIMLHHRNVENESFSKSLSYKLFSNTEENFEHDWRVGINKRHPLDLDFVFGIGKAFINLSELQVANCIINSASADITLGYDADKPNAIAMDTLQVRINMGNLEARQINLARAKTVLFDVNYGTIDISLDNTVHQGGTLHAMVGAGKLNMQLPDPDKPYKLTIKSSPMCRIHMPKHLRSTGNKQQRTYVSRGYERDPENALYVNVDISVGSLTLK